MNLPSLSVDLIRQANEQAFQLLVSTEPVWVAVTSAIDALETIDDRTILHAGPPIEWDRMAAVQRRGILLGALFEGLAETERDALRLIEEGKVKFSAAFDHGVVGGGVGIVTPSMKLIVCEDRKTGRRGFSPIWEGSSGLTAWGVLNDETRANLTRIIDIIGPALDILVRDCGGIGVKQIIAQGLQMGDDGHTREKAEGLLLSAEIVPRILSSDLDKATQILCCNTLMKTGRWFHSIGMASATATLRAIEQIEHCSLISGMAGNGVEFGIKVSGLHEEWFCSESPAIEGEYLSPDWGPDIAIPWLGESCVVENVGLGGLAAAAAPSVLISRGGTAQDAIAQTEEMRAICVGMNPHYPIPNLCGQGPPLGIDIMRIVETGILPQLHGGIISTEGGHIGRGSARVPLGCVEKAFAVFQNRYASHHL